MAISGLQVFILDAEQEFVNFHGLKIVEVRVPYFFGKKSTRKYGGVYVGYRRVKIEDKMALASLSS
jgi:hypothetical protein